MATRLLAILRGSVAKRAPESSRKMTVTREPCVERKLREILGVRQFRERPRQAQLRQVLMQGDAFDPAKQIRQVCR